MSAPRVLTAALTAFVLGVLPASAQQNVRVASYNIKFLSTDVTSQGDRLAKLHQVIARLDADVIGVQEVADRAALELVFPPDRWDVFIDDHSGDTQDLAIVVRHPLRIRAPDLDADDEDFLFPGPANDHFFPNRRDLLFAEISIPGSTSTFFVMVQHAKSRVGGRAATDARREGAAAALVRTLEQRFDERDFVLLGDFNDNPDDRSLNILETGDPTAAGGPEEGDGPFLINLMDLLAAADHVSHGRQPADITDGVVDTIDPGSRLRNNVHRGTNTHTGDILFDQLLIPMRMMGRYVPGSARVFDDGVALEGKADFRASDHLPVFADLLLGDVMSDPAATVHIASLLPNPVDDDAGREQVTIANRSGVSLNLAGWTLRDRAQNVFNLSGVAPGNGTLTITLSPHTMPLNNAGDEVSLIDPGGAVRHTVSYGASQVQPGGIIVVP